MVLSGIVDETAAEREIRLAKRREAWKNKTAEAKGKQKEYQRVCRQQRKAAESSEKKETRLEKRREYQKVYRQQKKAAESRDEKETRLEKRRKAAKEKTAKTKGKQNEYQRVYRRQKKAAESTEKKEARLANRREPRREAKGKQNGYNSGDKMQTETKYGENEKLQMTKHEKQSEKEDDERARIIEILKDHFPRASLNGQEQQDRPPEINMVSEPTVYEVNEQLSTISVNPVIEMSVHEAEDEAISVHEAGGAGMSKDEYLHEGGWQNVDNPLHELEFVRNEMHSFHLDQERLQHRQCTTCKEAWPTQQNVASEVYICYRCKRDKKSPKKFSAGNDMDPGIVPEQLKGLTQVEEMLISRVCPIMRVYRKHGGQRGYQGHVLNLPQDIQSFLNRLPSHVADLPVMVVRRHGADNTHRDFTVRRHKVLEAVLWLKTNNPYFKCIEIDREAIQILPENGIPEELRYVVDENDVSVHVENEGPPEEPAMSANGSLEELVLGNESTSFIPMRQRQRKEGAAIQDAVNETDPLDWPSTEDNIVNEFKTDGLATMAFPTLFPYGKGDPTNRARQHGITLTESFKHLMKFAERLANGKFEWRFASHPRFPYWALNMKQRHQLLSQANIYLRQHPADANMTMEELKEMVNSMSANQMVNRLQRYVSKVQGTNQYWYQRLQELLSLIEQKGCPTFFFTFSAADSHWPDLQRLLQNNEDATRTERAQAVIDNPHLTDWFFKRRLEEFIKHWLNGAMDAEWFWYRFEYQARGSIHAHGCAKLKNDPDIRLLRKKACLAFIENDKTRNELSTDDFDFFCQDVIKDGKDAEKLLIK